MSRPAVLQIVRLRVVLGGWGRNKLARSDVGCIGGDGVNKTFACTLEARGFCLEGVHRLEWEGERRKEGARGEG